MTFIDDEQHVAAGASKVSQGALQLGLQLEEIVGRFNLQGEQDLAIETGDGEMRVGEIDEVVDVAVERLSKGTEGRGLAGAYVAGDEGGEAFVQGEGQAPLDLLVPTRGIEILGSDRLGEGRLFEAIELIQSDHQVSPPVREMQSVA